MSTKLFLTNAYGWENCYALKSGSVELIATADVGPRIVYFGLAGGKNLFKLFQDQIGRTGDGEYHFYGGHRVWAAPEDLVYTYIPDNDPVRVSSDDHVGSLKLTRPADASNLERSLTLRVVSDNCESERFIEKSSESGFGLLGSYVVRNEIVNRGNQPVKTASWAISSFIPGGVGFMPLNPLTTPAKRLQAQFSINLWPYSWLNNPSYQWKEEWLEIDQRLTKRKEKIGFWNQLSWLAYRLGDLMIVIQVLESQKEQCEYPDLGSNLEIYFDPIMLELESLSAWQTLLPGESVFHDEVLSLIKLKGNPDNETAIRDYVYPMFKDTGE